MLPDATAVITAVWRALHVRRDPPPHVHEDVIGLGMADCPETLVRLGYAVPDEAGGPHWTDLPPFSGPIADLCRPEIVGRARFTEDLLLSLVESDRRPPRLGGCPWIGSYTPDEAQALAREAGFSDIHYQSTEATTQRYFSGRSDGLKVPSVEHLLVARTPPTARGPRR